MAGCGSPKPGAAQEKSLIATGALEALRESDIFKDILVIFTSFYNSNVIHILNGSHIGVLPQEIGDLKHYIFALGSLG